MTEPSPVPRRLRRKFGELGLVVILLLMGAVLTFAGGSVRRVERDPATGKRYEVVENKFLNAGKLIDIAKDASVFAVMAVGATFIIIAGGIDISVARIYVLAGLAGAAVLHGFGPDGTWGEPSGWLVVPLTAAVCIGVGLLGGLVNGAGVVLLRLHPFIVTLGTMAIFHGIAIVSTRQTIGSFHPAFIESFIRLPVADLYPVPLVITLAVAGWGTWYLAATVGGRRLYAVGGNETAARYSGLPVERIKIFSYVVGGMCAGVAAMINIGYLGAASPGDGAGYELEVIAAAVVGGAGLAGGRGTAIGAVLGALIINVISHGIIILGLDQNHKQIIIGAVILAAAWLDRRLTEMRARSTAA